MGLIKLRIGLYAGLIVQSIHSMSNELERRLDQLGVDSRTFQDLEEEFKKVIQELSGDPSMERFRREFEKLHKALKDSHEREKTHLKNCMRLKESLLQETIGVDSALKITHEDDMKVKRFQAELENVQRFFKGLQERQEKNESKIKELNNIMQRLEDQLKTSTTSATGKGNEINDLTTKRDDLRHKKMELEEEKRRLDIEVLDMKIAIENDTNKKAKMEKDLAALKASCEESQKVLVNNEKEKSKKLQDIEDAKKERQEATANREKLELEKRSTRAEHNKLEKQLQDQKHHKNKVTADIQKEDKEEKELKKKEIDQNHLKNSWLMQAKEKEAEFEKLTKLLTQGMNDLEKEEYELKKREGEYKAVKFARDAIVVERDTLKSTIYRLEREIDEHHKMVQEDNKLVIELTRDQNSIRDNLTKAKKINEEQNNECQKADKEFQKLNRDAAAVKKEIAVHDKRLAKLAVEINTKTEEATQASSKYFHLLEEIKLKDNLIAEFQKKNLETEAKLKQQQSLYEAVRSDRNIYSKNLTETQEEIAELRRRYKIITHQISQLKEEMTAKDIKLNQEYHKANDLKKNCLSLKNSNDAIREGMTKQDDNIKEFNNEIAKLQFIIKESEQQRTRLKEQYEMIVSERDILGTQLIRRNEELGLLLEKIKIQQSTLYKGQHQYKDKLATIEMLKETMRDLMRKLKGFKKTVQEIPDLKKNVHGLHKELVEERLKVKALSEELENPMNVHRWRKLEGTESEAYEMITKMHTLHK